jgi:hypothetical protein
MWADKGRKDANGFIVLMFVLIFQGELIQSLMNAWGINDII